MLYKMGYDGQIYVVFAFEEDAEKYWEKFGGEICCFNGYQNAVCVQTLWGM